MFGGGTQRRRYPAADCSYHGSTTKCSVAFELGYMEIVRLAYTYRQIQFVLEDIICETDVHVSMFVRVQ